MDPKLNHTETVCATWGLPANKKTKINFKY